MQRGELGWWWRSLGGARRTRPPLEGRADADVVIVGAGYTGLWSAYYLARADPTLRIVVLERELAGFGASGRNGGWVTGFFSGPERVYARGSHPAAYAALQRAMFETVDEIGRVVREHEIDADFLHHGGLSVALDDAQLARLRAHVLETRSHGVEEADLRLLDAEELARHVHVAGALGGSFSPHVARVHPAKLLQGLASVVEGLGVSIYEGTPVREIRPHAAVTATGAVTGRWVIRATEGYTASLRGLRRAVVPMNSSMVVTEPLPPAAWSQIGWDGCEPLGDEAYVFAYLQRTADGRIAIGGRGVPYRYGSRTDGRGATAAGTVAGLRAKLAAMFPAAAGVEIEHAWSGVLGVPRDWCVSVGADAERGIAWAGGYVGEGVAASNLAARTLRDLVLGERGELAALPWAGRTAPRWEPEPLRWLGIRGVYALYRQADRHERASGRPSRLGALVDRFSGRV